MKIEVLITLRNFGNWSHNHLTYFDLNIVLSNPNLLLTCLFLIKCFKRVRPLSWTPQITHSLSEADWLCLHRTKRNLRQASWSYLLGAGTAAFRFSQIDFRYKAGPCQAIQVMPSLQLKKQKWQNFYFMSYHYLLSTAHQILTSILRQTNLLNKGFGGYLWLYHYNHEEKLCWWI